MLVILRMAHIGQRMTSNTYATTYAEASEASINLLPLRLPQKDINSDVHLFKHSRNRKNNQRPYNLVVDPIQLSNITYIVEA